MTSPNVVRFPVYRAWEARRVEASNAMMALLAGSQLAAHFLQLTAGSPHLLPDVFPQVSHIRRFNLTTEEASAILISADTHLGAMSVPYALGLYEDYLRDCLILLSQAGHGTMGQAKRATLSAQHSTMESLTRSQFDTDRLIQLDTIRLMRNCTIHAGGRANSALVNKVSAWTSKTESLWSRLAPSLEGISIGDPVSFGQPQLTLALAVTKFLGREANVLMQRSIPRAFWADVVVKDLDERMVGLNLSEPQLLRKARGVARFDYGPLALTDNELDLALARL